MYDGRRRKGRTVVKVLGWGVSRGEVAGGRGGVVRFSIWWVGQPGQESRDSEQWDAGWHATGERRRGKSPSTLGQKASFLLLSLSQKYYPFSLPLGELCAAVASLRCRSDAWLEKQSAMAQCLGEGRERGSASEFAVRPWISFREYG